MPRTAYNAYIKTEWEMFVGNPGRARASLAATEGMEVTRVLDVGCGAGQELVPFVVERKALGVGIDFAPQVGQVGRNLFATHALPGNVVFMRAAAESLPFRSQVFDVVICRLALPYTGNRPALDEIARVLRDEGVCLLKIHHARYYFRSLKRALSSLDVRTAIHDIRVLMAGAIYHVSGKQLRNKLMGYESFQTRWLIRRELDKRGLFIVGEMPDSNPATPSFIVSNRRLPEDDQLA